MRTASTLMIISPTYLIRMVIGGISDCMMFWRLGAKKIPNVLTHPVWWTPEPMSPRARVARAIDGRASCVHAYYDRSLAKGGRENIR